jgi:hypothetical protein
MSGATNCSSGSDDDLCAVTSSWALPLWATVLYTYFTEAELFIVVVFECLCHGFYLNVLHLQVAYYSAAEI